MFLEALSPGRDRLLHENYTFYRCGFVKNLNAQEWKCANKSCSAKIYTGAGGLSSSVRKEGTHKHEPHLFNRNNRVCFSAVVTVFYRKANAT